MPSAREPQAPAALTSPEQMVSDTEGHLSVVKRGAAGILTGNLAGQALRYASAVLIGRLFGPAVFGAFGLVTGLLRFTEVPGREGLAQSNLKYIPQSLALGNPNGVRATVAITTALSLVLGLLQCLIVIACAPLLARLYDRPDLVSAFRVAALIIPLSGTAFTLLAVLQGARRVAPLVCIGRIGIPLLFLAGVAIAAGAGGRLNAVLWAYVAATAVALLLAAGVVVRWLPPPEPGGKRGVRLREVVSFSLTMCVISFSHLIIGQADVIILAKYADADSLGWYYAASRTAAFIVMPLTAITGVFSPTISALYAQRDISGLKEMYETTTRWSTGAAVGLFGLFAIAPTLTMGTFGEGFKPGGPILVLLAAGRLLDAATGSNGSVLTMTGQQRCMAWTSWLAAASLVGALLYAAPLWGAIGAAMAVMAVMVAVNVVRIVWIWHYLRIQPYTRSYWLCAAATVGTIAACSLLSQQDPTDLGWQTITALAAFAIIYAALLKRGWAPGMLAGLRSRRTAARTDPSPDGGLPEP